MGIAPHCPIVDTSPPPLTSRDRESSTIKEEEYNSSTYAFLEHLNPQVHPWFSITKNKEHHFVFALELVAPSPSHTYHIIRYMSDCELYPIGDEEDTSKSFLTFNITPLGHVFRVVVRSQIVVHPTIPPLQRHCCDSNPWPLALISFVGPWAVSFHLKTNWWWGRHIQIFYGIQYHTIWTCF